MAAWQMRSNLLKHAVPKRERRRRRWLSGGTGRTDERIKPVLGQAILWRELRLPAMRSTIIIAIGVLIFAGTSLALFWASGRSIVFLQIHAYVMMGLSLLVGLRTTGMAALSIAAEKEGHTWPLLLTTPLSDRQIIGHKACAVFLRNLPLWIALLAVSMTYYLLLTLMYSPSQPVVFAWRSGWYAAQSIAYTLSFIVLLLGAGLYSGMRCRSRTAAVVTAMLVIVGTWIVARLAMNVAIRVLAVTFFGFAAYAIGSTFLWCGLYGGLGVLLLGRTKKGLRRCPV